MSGKRCRSLALFLLDGLLRSCLERHFNLLLTVAPDRGLTLDIDLRFSGCDTVLLPGIAVAEVKQAGNGRPSDFMRVMRECHIRSSGFSKYCIGVSLLYPDVKHNNFKAHQCLLRKLVQGGSRDPR